MSNYNLNQELCGNLSSDGKIKNFAFCINNNNSLLFDDDGADLGQESQEIIATIVTILFGLIIIVGLIGNFLVIIVVSCNQLMRNPTNILITNLAIADLLFIICCVPFTAIDYILPYWPFGNLWCKMVQYLIVVTAYASVYALVLMVLNRFLGIVYPLRSMPIRTEGNAKIASAVMWVVSLLLAAPVLSLYGEVPHTFQRHEFSVCMITRPDWYNELIYPIFFFSTSYAIPLATICGLYIFMIIRLWGGVAPGGHISAESKRGKKRVTRMVVIVVLIFAFCWCPIQIILVLKSLDRYEITWFNVMLQISSQVLAYANSCLNPILYAFLSENFRKAFRKVMYCGPDRNAQSRLVNGRNNDAERSGNQTRTTRAVTTNNDIA